MNNRRAKIRGSAWKEYEFVCLAISVGKPAHEGADLEAAIEMIESTGKPCVIRLSDTLQRHNFMAEGVEAERAWALSHAAGTAWFNRYEMLLNELTIKPIVVRWDEVLNHPDFQAVYADFIRLSQENTVVSEALQRDIDKFLSRRSFDSEEKKALAAKCSLDFLLEETAGQTILGRQYGYARFYPGKPAEILVMAQKNTIDGLPRGLDRTSFVRFSLETTRHAVMDSSDSTPPSLMRDIA